MANLLSDDQVATELASLSDWYGDSTAITRVVRLGEDAVPCFLNDLERIAREMNHDPAVDRSGGELTITMSTHSAGGVTELDIEYARRVDALLAG
jgi:4a-hydroxytetrahydrobiopterin dehydratase